MKRIAVVARAIRRSFWWMILMQGLEEATGHNVASKIALWAATVAAIYVAMLLSGFGNNAWDELRVAILSGILIAFVTWIYYVLRIPPRLLEDVFKEGSWRLTGDAFTELQSEGQRVADGFAREDDFAARKAKREHWRQKVLVYCDELSPSWRAQFEYQGGLQKEVLAAKMVNGRTASRAPIPDEEFEFMADFLTEIEQVKGFAKFSYDRAMQLTRLRP